MKTKLFLIGALLTCLALGPNVYAKGGHEGKGQGGGRGGGGGAKMKGGRGGAKIGDAGSRPTISQPGGGGGSGSFRPHGGNQPSISRPGGGGGGGHLGNVKPRPRPSQPVGRPAPRPGGSGSGLPSMGGGNRPGTKPGARPGMPIRPTTKPAPIPGTRPGGGGGGDFIGIKPDRPGGGRPGIGDGGKPGRPGGGEQWRPGDHTKPWPPDGRPDRPGGGNRPDRPGGDGRPLRPGDWAKPWPRPDRPGGGGGGEQWRPGDHRPNHRPRPPRPNRPDRWQNIHNNNANQWNKWKQNNYVNVNKFKVDRSNRWKTVNNYYGGGNWAGRYGSDEYWDWRNDVWDYRKDRCEEIWDHREDYWDDIFDDHWWGSCWWRPNASVSLSVNTTPWWWWNSPTWASVTSFFGAALAPQPVVYDPGTTVIYEGDTYYVNGKDAGSATDAREAATQLATPPIEQIPVPEPAAEGEPETWLPLGVWALTQQEQGDANMFMQLSVDKNGIVAGAYKNVMTGDEQPIVGQLDKQNQRIAWHVGDAVQTVYETGFSSLGNDVASVFVHFGATTTQTWLLVRLPSPEIPPGIVKLPEIKKP